MSLVADRVKGQPEATAEAKKAVSILGVPLAYGASMAGVDMGPAALRVAGLPERIATLGYSVRDLGDMRLERSRFVPAPGDKLKHLREITTACEELAGRLRRYWRSVNLPWSSEEIIRSPSVQSQVSLHTVASEKRVWVSYGLMLMPI